MVPFLAPSRLTGSKIARAVNLVIEQLEGRVLLSGTLPAAVHASTDAVYSATEKVAGTILVKHRPT
ncbi:MAG TPA: LEPR-XLL domain-containing protein [Tepidisphaeraceae bacterium]|jgi:hypothetical protein|nr:LEPR-XLL domain-containing protein [Tepidisphaeraceae bacterium]